MGSFTTTHGALGRLGETKARSRPPKQRDGLVFSDDGISGAEFKRRPGLTALLTAAEAKAFDVLGMSEPSRLGREQHAQRCGAASAAGPVCRGGQPHLEKADILNLEQHVTNLDIAARSAVSLRSVGGSP